MKHGGKYSDLSISLQQKQNLGCKMHWKKQRNSWQQLTLKSQSSSKSI